MTPRFLTDGCVSRLRGLLRCLLRGKARPIVVAIIKGTPRVPKIRIGLPEPVRSTLIPGGYPTLQSKGIPRLTRTA